MEYLLTYASRVRRLRETANLTIQRACERAGIAPNTWSKIERGEQEPCLLVIKAMAEGLGISVQTLMSIDEKPGDNSKRSQINDILDLSTPDEWDLILKILKAIREQRSNLEQK